MNAIYFALYFLDSFIVYTALRRFDERSTAKLASRVDIYSHEVNPTITWLAKRFGLTTAFRITWLILGTGIGLIDASLNERFPYGVPLFALIVGFSHVLAAGNNIHVAHVVDKIGVQEFEAEQDKHMRELAAASWKKKIDLVFKGNPISFIVTVFSIPLLIALSYDMIATELFTVVVSHNIALVIPLNIAFSFIIALLLVQTAYVLGPLILARRYSKKIKKEKATEPTNELVNLELPVSVVAEALDAARTQGQSVVKISVSMQNQRV